MQLANSEPQRWSEHSLQPLDNLRQRVVRAVEQDVVNLHGISPLYLQGYVSVEGISSVAEAQLF